MRWLGSALVAVLLLAGCGDDESAASSRDVTDGGRHRSVTVLAAASLTDAFTELAAEFEAAEPGISVELSFGSSSSLREQILGGAPADVFASANRSNMAAVVDAGLARDPEVFATNQLQLAVPSDNPGDVDGLEDLADPDLLIGLCAEEVPCGEFGRQVLAAAGVTPSIDTNAPDVRALLTQLESGDLDAGIVYETDVLASGDAVVGIDIPAADNVVAAYPIAALTDAGDMDAAQAFVAFVRSARGQPILTSFGFGSP
jgi:molybdate transport system substrate-binding protein